MERTLQSLLLLQRFRRWFDFGTQGRSVFFILTFDRLPVIHLLIQINTVQSMRRISIYYTFLYTFIQMDVIFHRNCLDGSYSAYLMYLFCQSLKPETYALFVAHLQKQNSPVLAQFRSKNGLKQMDEVNENLFHQKPEVHFHGVSMYAGDLFPIFPSKQGNILFLVDISPESQETMLMMANRFSYVVIIDHHLTFNRALNFINKSGLKNVFYWVDQSKCASLLVYDFLLKGFGFPNNYPEAFRKDLQLKLQQINKNDMKIKQDKTTKMFVLGFYYFQIDLSHQNPNLFKRIWGLPMQTIMQKGKNRYKLHMDCLRQQMTQVQLCRFAKSQYKGMTFYISKSEDRSMVSDLGALMAFLSVKNGGMNLAIIAKKNGAVYRASVRSYKETQSKPYALQIAQIFQGGGHLCAAGFTTDSNKFNNYFKTETVNKNSLQITQQQIQNILFAEALKKQGN